MKTSEIIKRLAVGEKTTVYGKIDSVRVLCSRIGGYTVRKSKGNSHTVTRTGIRTASIAQAIRHLISLNNGNDQFFPYNPSQVRVAVSNYNRKTGRKLRVRDAEAGCTVYENIEDRSVITEEDYKKIEADFMDKLAALRKKIVSEKKWI